MRDITLLGGLLVVLMYALGVTRQMKEEEPNLQEETEEVEDWEVVKCEKVEQRGDTIICIQTLVRARKWTR